MEAEGKEVGNHDDPGGASGYQASDGVAQVGAAAFQKCCFPQFEATPDGGCAGHFADPFIGRLEGGAVGKKDYTSLVVRLHLECSFACSKAPGSRPDSRIGHLPRLPNALVFFNTPEVP